MLYPKWWKNYFSQNTIIFIRYFHGNQVIDLSKMFLCLWKKVTLLKATRHTCLKKWRSLLNVHGNDNQVDLAFHLCEGIKLHKLSGLALNIWTSNVIDFFADKPIIFYTWIFATLAKGDLFIFLCYNFLALFCLFP